MHPSAPSIRALLGSLGLVTGLTGIVACGGSESTAPGGDSGSPPPACGNAANCNEAGVDANGNNFDGEGPRETSTPFDGGDEASFPCGNAATLCDSGPGADSAADATPEAATDATFDGPRFGCGTGNGPVCPPDASE
jgi:hypothetical protein